MSLAELDAQILDLHQEQELPQVVIAHRLGLTQSQVSRRLRARGVSCRRVAPRLAARKVDPAAVAVAYRAAVEAGLTAGAALDAASAGVSRTRARRILAEAGIRIPRPGRAGW